jgi:murein DD-endopeptidase MepM/ murein hydrolase activator NlpD
LSFDPISNITQLTLTKEQFEQLIARPIVLVEQDRQNHPEVSVSITRALHTDQINYSLYSTLLAKKSEKIDLQSTVLLSDIQPGETITISFISKESDENYTALIKIAGDYPFLKRDFRLRWGEYDVSHPILTLDAQDLFALEKAALSILLDGKQLKQTDRPIIGSYASGRNDGKWAGYSLRNPAYFPYSELPELIEDRLVEMQEFVQAKQEGKTYQRFLRSRPILIPYEEDKYLPLIIALDQDKPSFKTSDQILLGPHQLSYPINPVNIQKISSGFGPRVHPIYKVKRLHRGIDLIAPLGTPILAAAYGEVTEVEEKTDGYGKKIVIQHADGLSTVYAQLQSIGVQVGDRVQKKTIIGTLGSSGASTGPHLHFEIHEDGRPKDPMDYLPELEK